MFDDTGTSTEWNESLRISNPNMLDQLVLCYICSKIQDNFTKFSSVTYILPTQVGCGWLAVYACIINTSTLELKNDFIHHQFETKLPT